MPRTTLLTVSAVITLSALLAACGGSGGGDSGLTTPPGPEPVVATATASVAAHEMSPGTGPGHFEPIGFDLKFSIPMDNVQGGTWRVVGPLGEVGGSITTLADGKTMFFQSTQRLYAHAQYRIEIQGLKRSDGVPITLSPIAPVRVPVREMVALGVRHACALRGNGRIRCWGQGDTGVLGTGHPDAVGDGPGEMGDALTDVDLGTDASGKPPRAVELVAGFEHNCARLESGDVKCWGANLDGQLGRGDAVRYVGVQPGQMGNALPAVKLGAGRTAVYLAAGHWHTCAVLDNQQLKCWGNNAYGVLGVGLSNPRLGLNPGEMGDALLAVNLGSGRVAVDLSAADHTCAVLQVGEIKCWGANEVGQLGQGDLVDRGQLPAQMGDALLPIDLGPGPWKRVVTGVTHTGVLHSVGTVKCWGKNDAGELGQGDLQDRIGKPGELLDDVSVKPAHFALGLYAGQGLTCTKLDDQKLYCWGRGGHGQLGLDSDQLRGGVPKDMGSHMKAVLLPAGKRISDVVVSPSGHQACARLSDGAGYRCWGSNLGRLVLPGAGPAENIGDAANEMGTLQPIDLGLAVP